MKPEFDPDPIRKIWTPLTLFLLQMKYICFCIVGLFCFCINNDAQHISYTISLEKEIDNFKPADLKEIGSTVSYIPLETSENCLLKDKLKIVITDTHIAVCDWDKVLLFDTSGRFITEIGKRGQGPEEYIQLDDFCFSLDGRSIYLSTAYDNKFKEYDVEGKFLRSFTLESGYSRVLPLKDDLFVFHPANTPSLFPQQPDDSQYSLVIIDSQNNIKKMYKNHHKLAPTTRFVMYAGLDAFYFHKGNMRFKEHGTKADTLFTVTEKELIPYALFHMGRKQMPADISVPASARRADNTIDKDKALRPYAGKYFVCSARDDNDNLYFVLSDWRKYYFGYYNKHSNTAKVTGEERFRNNIDGGLPFFPKYVYNDDVLVDCVNAFELREHVLSGNAAEMKKLYGKNYDDLVNLVNSLEEDANPIVIMVKK